MDRYEGSYAASIGLKRVRLTKKKSTRDETKYEVLSLDPRDQDVVKAKRKEK